MSVRILHDDGTAALYCSTTEIAFGPLIHDETDHDAVERAEAFIRWLPQDARHYDEKALLSLFSEWRAQEDAQWAREEEVEA